MSSAASAAATGAPGAPGAAATTASSAAAPAAPPPTALLSPMQMRVEAARAAHESGLAILGVAPSARTVADFEVIAGFGLLLDRLSSMGAPLFLGAVLPMLEKKRVFGWARCPGGFKCLLCMLNSGGGKVDISCSNVEKNAGDQWVSHASTHHKALLAKSVERTTGVPAATSVSQSRIAALFSRAGPSAAAASAGAGSVDEAAAAAAASSSRADTGRNMARYNFVTERMALLFAECALPFRLADNDSFKKLLVACSSKPNLTLADIGGRKAVMTAINSRAELDMREMQTQVLNLLGLDDNRKLNGKPLVSLAAGVADGWSATADASSMQTGTVYIFSGNRLYTFGTGYTETAGKTSEQTFNAQHELMARVVPLGSCIGRTVDWGSDGMSKAALKLWQIKVEAASGKIKFYSIICAAHALDKALYWAATAGEGFASVVKGRVIVAAAGGGAEAAAAAAAQGSDEVEDVSSSIAKKATLAIRMGAVSFSSLAGDLFAIASAIRNSPAAHKKLRARSGYIIPKMVITRWGVYSTLLARGILLWPIIKAMDPVELGLYHNAAAAAASWPSRMLAVDNNLPAMALALAAQRTVMTALEVLGTKTQPTLPLVQPVIVSMLESVRQLTEAAFDKGAFNGQEPAFLEEMKPLVDGKPTKMRLRENESPMLMALRYLIGLQHALFKRYPFELVEGTGKQTKNGYSIRSKNALVDVDDMKLSLKGVPLFTGRIRLLTGKTPCFTGLHVLATVVHPRLSLAALAADPALFRVAKEAAASLFGDIYGEIAVGDGSSFNPLRGLGESEGESSYGALLLSGVRAMHKAFLADTVYSSSSNRYSLDDYDWLNKVLGGSHNIIFAAQRALYAIAATSADAERTNSMGALTWSKQRRNLKADNGSSAIVVAQRSIAVKAQQQPPPVLADIQNLPEILHSLDAQVVDDDGKNVLPELLAPPSRRISKTEESLRGHTDALKLSGLSAVMSAFAIPDDIDEPGSGELLEALDSMAFIADDDADAIMPVRLFADMLVEESDSEDGGHAASSGGVKAVDAPASELAPAIYGRAQNRSLRIILKAAADDEMEQQRAAAVAAADASAAAEAAAAAAAAAAASAPAAAGKRKREPPAPAQQAVAAAAAAAAVTVDDDEGSGSAHGAV